MTGLIDPAEHQSVHAPIYVVVPGGTSQRSHTDILCDSESFGIAVDTRCTRSGSVRRQDHRKPSQGRAAKCISRNDWSCLRRSRFSVQRTLWLVRDRQLGVLMPRRSTEDLTRPKAFDRRASGPRIREVEVIRHVLVHQS
jgi:hypothetical protein